MFFVADYDAVCAIMTTSLPPSSSLALSIPPAHLPFPPRMHALCPLIPVPSFFSFLSFFPFFFFSFFPPIFKRFPPRGWISIPSPSRSAWILSLSLALSLPLSWTTPRLLPGREVCSCPSPTDARVPLPDHRCISPRSRSYQHRIADDPRAVAGLSPYAVHRSVPRARSLDLPENREPLSILGTLRTRYVYNGKGIRGWWPTNR